MKGFAIAVLCAVGAQAENEMRFFDDDSGLEMKTMCFNSEDFDDCVTVPVEGSGFSAEGNPLDTPMLGKSGSGSKSGSSKIGGTTSGGSSKKGGSTITGGGSSKKGGTSKKGGSTITGDCSKIGSSKKG